MATGFPDYSIGFVGAIIVPNGGTGLTSIAAGALIYGNGSGTMGVLATTFANYILTSGGIAQAPAWANQIAPEKVTVVAGVTTDDKLTIAGASGQTGYLLKAIAYPSSTIATLDNSGILIVQTLEPANALGVVYGGTSATSCATGQILIGTGTNTAAFAKPDGCKLSNSTTISMATGTLTTFTWDTEIYNNGSIHSIATNPGRVTIAKPGIYLAIFHVSFASNAVGSRQGYIRVNGSTYIAQIYDGLSAGDVDVYSIAALHAMTVGDYFEALAEQDSGSTLTTIGARLDYQSFEVQWLGP